VSDLSLSGTTLSITLENGNTVTLDIASIDTDTNTDDQIVSDLSLTGTTLSITLENGNTATLDLASLDTDTDTDDQTLTLTGSILAIADGNSVDLGALLGADDQTLSVSGGSIKIADGNTINFPVQTIYVETYAAGSDDGLNTAWTRNVKMGRSGVGMWSLVFLTPHPDGSNYAVSILTEEESNLRDSVLPSIIQGSKTPNGFDFMLLTGDNGLNADPAVDAPFTVAIDAPVDVLIPAP